MHTRGDDLFAAGGLFAAAELAAYPWERTVTADEWLGAVATVSDHQRLGSQRLPVLLRALRSAIDGLGGVVHLRHETYALLSRRF